MYVKGKPHCLIMSTFVVRSLFTASMVMLKFFAELLKTKKTALPEWILRKVCRFGGCIVFCIRCSLDCVTEV